MTIFDRIIPVAFLACVALTACNSDQPGHDGYPTDRPAGPVDTVSQPNMPAPAAAPEGERAQDSAATKPLASLDAKKENTGMPEALHGNNHSSPAVGSSGPAAGSNGANAASSPLKKSSLIGPKSPKVIWI